MPGSARRPVDGGRERTARRRDRAGAGVQVAGAGVVAEAGPGGHHRRLGCRRQGRDIGEAREEAFVVGCDRGHRCLLQHHLAEPDAIGVGRRAGRRAPGQGAAVPVVPGEQEGGVGNAHAEGSDNRRGAGQPPARLRPGAGGGAAAGAHPRCLPPPRRRDPAIAADWEAIVGPALAAVTAPRKLAAGTLTMGCSGPIALELQHLADQLVARINMHLGGAPVQRLRFVQFPPAPQAPPAPPPAALPAEAAARLEATLAGLPGELHAALAALGAALLRSRRGDRL